MLTTQIHIAIKIPLDFIELLKEEAALPKYLQ